MLGRELRKARSQVPMTQEELAFKAGVSREYLSQLENDRKSPTVKVFLRLCHAMGVSAADLIGRVDRAR
ncbi:MAG TPA: helix-turn-helix transcriptional regulator [Humisphaera sp.]